MKIKRIKFNVLFGAISFLMVLIVLRLIWIDYHDHEGNFPYAKEGLIDFKGVEFDKSQLGLLNGEWEFYPNALLSPEDFRTEGHHLNKTYINVPAMWKENEVDTNDKYEYGTYRLRMLMKNDGETSYGIRIPLVQSAFKLYVDGKLIGESGEVATEKVHYSSNKHIFRENILSSSDEIEVVLQVANSLTYHKKSGILKPISFGSSTNIANQKMLAYTTELIVCAIFFIYLLYVGLLVIVGIRQKVLVTFSLLLIFTMFSILVDDEKQLLSWLSLGWEWNYKLIYIAYVAAASLLVQFVRDLLTEYKRWKLINLFIMLCRVYLVFVFVAPIEIVLSVRLIFSIIFIASPLIVLYLILRTVLKGKTGSIFLLLGAIAIANNIIWAMIKGRSELLIGYYPFDMLASIILLSAYWFHRYFQSTIETKNLSEKLQIANDQKDEFLANTSHELRNPLHGIMNIAQVVLTKEGKKLEKDNKANMELLISIGNHMSYLLNDLLDLTQLKQQTVQLQMKSIDVKSVALGVCDMQRFSINHKRVKLVVAVDDAFPHIWADENRFIQILFNLVSNAVKFTDEGTVSITGRVQGEQAFINVQDTGIGIDEATQERIFGRYEQQGENMFAGLGLGLSICKELVELHGGEISVNSVLGEGATFTFSMPLAHEENFPQNEQVLIEEKETQFKTNELVDLYSMDSKQPVIHAHSSMVLKASKPRLLIVDDDPINLHVIVQALETDDYKVETALSGEEALKKLGSNTYDLLVSDIMMPQMSGYELVRIVREKFTITELPIIFLTARSRKEDISTAFHVGANDYVTKPVDLVELQARIQALVHVKQSTEERLRMEGAWLQAQIQPHFFFNTLNSIIALHTVNGEKMEELLFAFSDYLQKSFSFQNADLVVPIAYELDIVRAYIAIQQIRFDGRITVHFDVPENIELSVPPLAIQTLVENAIEHGILQKVEGGTITIRITESDEQFVVSVIDDGVGFDTSAMRRSGGIGMVNTSQRLMQLFNAELSIKSTVDKGTTISFPIVK